MTTSARPVPPPAKRPAGSGGRPGRPRPGRCPARPTGACSQPEAGLSSAAGAAADAGAVADAVDEVATDEGATGVAAVDDVATDETVAVASSVWSGVAGCGSGWSARR